MGRMDRGGGDEAFGLMGLLLAGGESTRFGEAKALAPLAGRPMARWGLDCLGARFRRCGVLANDPAVAAALGVPGRQDDTPGLGPLGGLITGLRWAREEGCRGVFLLACDLPLVTPGLLDRILAPGFGEGWALVPESRGPLGMEPLCGAYLVGGLEAAREAVASGRRSMKALLEVVPCIRVSLDQLGPPEESTLAFTNVNTREDALRVEPLLPRAGGVKGRPTQGEGSS